MDKTKAIELSKTGAVVAFISAGLTTALVFYATLNNINEGIFSTWNDSSNLIDILLVTACGIGMLRCSRAAAVIALLYFIVAKIIISIETGINPFSIWVFIVLYFYARAIHGTFVYHRIEKEENPDYKRVPKWIYYFGIPVGVLFFALMGLGIMSMTGVVPSTEVIEGLNMSQKDRSLLIEKGIIQNDEQIEYFYSGGFSSILESGNILTDQRVIVYTQDETDKLLIYELLFHDIANIKLIKEGNFMNDSIYEVQSFYEDAWLRLNLSAENRGDATFVEALRSKISEG